MDHHGLNKRAILERLLVCPACHGELKDEGERYACMGCRRIIPVVSGIPRFLPDLSDKEQQVDHSFNFEHTRYLDSRYLHFTPQLIRQWLDDIKLPPDYFKGKLVLDAGCGSGRWTYAMASLGATVVAVDLTDAGVAITHQATAQLDNVAVLQASVFELPFRPESFDLVVSWGVLHHTPDTRAAFERIAPLVKKGGQLYVMIYEKHNPLKFFLTDLLRRALRTLSEERRHRACRRLIIRNPWLYSLLAHLIICAPYPRSGDSSEVSTLQFGLYDAYAPVFNHLHRREEVEGWFRDCRFSQLTLTGPVRFTAWKDVVRSGECGGSIRMRGVRT
jgi:2-polyprenyl-3-methyl-5-hydroxy-6-metoxy-1,4-benzoquinol methylase